MSMEVLGRQGRRWGGAAGRGSPRSMAQQRRASRMNLCCQHARQLHPCVRIIDLTYWYFTQNFRCSGLAGRATAASGISCILPGCVLMEWLVAAGGAAWGGRLTGQVTATRRTDDSTGWRGGRRQCWECLAYCQRELPGGRTGWCRARHVMVGGRRGQRGRPVGR